MNELSKLLTNIIYKYTYIYTHMDTLWEKCESY